MTEILEDENIEESKWVHCDAPIFGGGIHWNLKGYRIPRKIELYHHKVVEDFSKRIIEISKERSEEVHENAE